MLPANTPPLPLPQYALMVRPGAPAVVPVFRKSSHLKNWELNERKQNKKYSNEIYYKKLSAWKEQHKWNDVPLMTSMTKEEAEKARVKYGYGNDNYYVDKLIY